MDSLGFRNFLGLVKFAFRSARVKSVKISNSDNSIHICHGEIFASTDVDVNIEMIETEGTEEDRQGFWVTEYSVQYLTTAWKSYETGNKVRERLGPTRPCDRSQT